MSQCEHCTCLVPDEELAKHKVRCKVAEPWERRHFMAAGYFPNKSQLAESPFGTMLRGANRRRRKPHQSLEER